MKNMSRMICLLLVMALFLSACGKQKNYETTYDYLIDNIAEATPLPNGGFVTFSDVKEVNAAALSSCDLPKEVDHRAKPIKCGDYWFLIDVDDFSDEYMIAQQQTIYCLKDGQWIELFNKTMHPLYSKTHMEMPHEISLHLYDVYDNKLFFEVYAITQNLGPKTYTLYGVDIETKEFFVAYEEKTNGRTGYFVFIDGSAYVQNCDIEDFNAVLDSVRIDLDDLKVTKFAKGEDVVDQNGDRVTPFDAANSNEDPGYNGEVKYGELSLSAKEVNALHEVCDKIEDEIIFPPENEASLNKTVVYLLTKQMKDDTCPIPVLLPAGNNDNAVEARGAFYGENIVMETYGWTEDSNFFGVLVYNGVTDTLYDAAYETRDEYIRIQTYYTQTEFAFIANGRLTVMDMTKIQ